MSQVTQAKAATAKKVGPRPKTQDQLDRITLWAAKNRGIQSQIAAEMKPIVTPQFVHHVLMGRRKSKGGVVEKKLRAAGAPI